MPTHCHRRTAPMSFTSNELTPGLLIYEVAILVGTTILPSLVYGINSTLVFMTFRLLWRGRTADTRKRTLLMATYITLICALSTAHWVLSCVNALSSLVILALDHNPRFEPGHNLVNLSAVAMFAVGIIYIILTWLTDGLLVRVYA